MITIPIWWLWILCGFAAVGAIFSAVVCLAVLWLMGSKTTAAREIGRSVW